MASRALAELMGGVMGVPKVSATGAGLHLRMQEAASTLVILMKKKRQELLLMPLSPKRQPQPTKLRTHQRALA